MSVHKISDIHDPTKYVIFCNKQCRIYQDSTYGKEAKYRKEHGCTGSWFLSSYTKEDYDNKVKLDNQYDELQQKLKEDEEKHQKEIDIYKYS